MNVFVDWKLPQPTGAAQPQRINMLPNTLDRPLYEAATVGPQLSLGYAIEARATGSGTISICKYGEGAELIWAEANELTPRTEAIAKTIMRIFIRESFQNVVEETAFRRG